MKVLILGGYGVFGWRLVQLLADRTDLEILVAGRDLERAKAQCAGFQGLALVRPLCLDRKDIAAALTQEAPDLVVDASGPFQDYGQNAYGVVEACIAQRVHYLDLADGADFVFGINRFDAAAQQAGVFVLSGVSSFPVLTAAVLRQMAKTMRVTAIEAGISPSPFAGIGLNVMRAVVGYAGSPVSLIRKGKPFAAKGLVESRRFTIAVPGRMPLRNIHFSLVDVPDLRVIPPEYPGLDEIWVGAGPVPESLHRVLNLLAWARARFGLPSFVPLSGLFYRVLNLMRFGEHRGGMYLRAWGEQSGRKTYQTWHLLAEGDDGPFIPSMPIAAILRKGLAGEWPAVGARPAIKALELSDYEDIFATKTIFTGMRGEDLPGEPLYRRILGVAFDQLPEQVRHLHDSTESRRWAGQASVRRGKGLISRLIGRLIGLPAAAESTSVLVHLEPQNHGEKWTRTFDGNSFSSFQSCGLGRNAHLLLERFGAIQVALALVVDEDRLRLIPRRWFLLGVPMPRVLLPGGASFETQANGKFCFDVEISVPLLGLIAAYKGVLDPV